MEREKPLNVHEAKAQFSELLDRAHAGQEIVVSKKGKPWAKMVPIGTVKRRELGFAKGVVGDAFFEPLPEAELRAWEGSVSRDSEPAPKRAAAAAASPFAKARKRK